MVVVELPTIEMLSRPNPPNFHTIEFVAVRRGRVGCLDHAVRERARQRPEHVVTSGETPLYRQRTNVERQVMPEDDFGERNFALDVVKPKDDFAIETLRASSIDILFQCNIASGA